MLGGQTVDMVLGGAIGGRLGRMTCPPARSDSDGMKAVYVVRGSRAAVDASALRARYAARAARGTARRGTAHGTRGPRGTHRTARGARDRAGRGLRRARVEP